MRKSAVFLLSTMLILISFSAWAGEKAAPDTAGPVLVLAGFGSTQDERDTLFEAVSAKVRLRYPDVRIERAWTSKHYSRTRSNPEKAPNPAIVLGRLGAEGCTVVAVQSLHVVPGYEYDSVKEITERFANMPKLMGRTACGAPLIGSFHDADALADILVAANPVKAGEAVILVGHGAHNGSGSLAYPALENALKRRSPYYFVDNLEGEGGLEPILTSLRKSGIKRVYLMPLLTTLGDHANNDIFGKEADSRQSRIAAAGFTVVPMQKSLADLPDVAGIYAEHAVETLQSLGFAPKGGQ